MNKQSLMSESRRREAAIQPLPFPYGCACDPVGAKIMILIEHVFDFVICGGSSAQRANHGAAGSVRALLH